MSELLKTVKQMGSIRIRTAFMAALAAFEAEYGDLWGRGKDPEGLTPDEREELKIYQRLRKSIMDKGNHQLRHWESTMNATIQAHEKLGE